MINTVKKFLSKVLVVFFALTLCCGATYAVSDNFTSGDVGDFGSWATDANREMFISNIGSDLNSFESGFQKQYIDTGVPIEAKLGMALMNALSHVAKVLDMSLVRFVNIFLIVAYIFWIMLEAYRGMKDSKVKVGDNIKNIIRKGVVLAFWLILLDGSLQKLFGYVMGPIIAIGSYVANFILDAVASVGGLTLSDNCAAIQQYAAANASEHLITDAKFAGQILCLPTRLSGFYYAAILYGWGLVKTGIGLSAFTCLSGIALIVMFTYAAYKFLFVAFGVIADLFLVVIMLPFTAISETLNKTSYEGIAGKIYNGFLGVFKPLSLTEQINKYVNAAVYFISLAIVVAIGGAVLASVVQYNPGTHTFSIGTHSGMELFLVGALVAYIAGRSDEIAKQMGGAIDYALGTKLSSDIKTLYNDLKAKTKKVYSAIRDSKK